MNYILTGSTGHITKPLATHLLNAGHQVTIISTNPAKAAEIEAMGAIAAIGTIEDVDFLTKTFSGADAVYTMVPPKWDAPNWKAHIHQMGKNFVAAIKNSGVKKVVNLSSIGAHMPEGCGPVSGVHYVEQELNALPNTDVLHLRPGYFYYNLFANIGMIKHMGILGANFGEHTTMVLVHTNDIAEKAAEALLNVSFTGKTIQYIASDERTTTEIASVLGNAIGKPELPWVNFTDQQAFNGMLQAGLSEEVANNYTEMGRAMTNGNMSADYMSHRPAKSPTKLEDFAKEFAIAFAHA